MPSGQKPETGYREHVGRYPDRCATVSDSANRKQVGQLNRCRLVSGTNLISSDRHHCISMLQVGQVGTSRSSSECFSLSITTLPRSSDESPKPNRQSL